MHKKLNILKGISLENDQSIKLTFGQVVDTNDPQQMGRIRVMSQHNSENEDTKVNTLPWATPISPLGGTSDTIARGRDEVQTDGYVAYGMFNVPKVGSFVLVGCLEGNPGFRIYLGSLYDQHLPHTMPHGRYSYDKKNDKLNGDEPSGPFSSSETAIEPLYDSLTKAFTKGNTPTGQKAPPPRKNYEFRTRGADQGVSGLSVATASSGNVVSENNDSLKEKFVEGDGNEISYTFGYNESQIQKGLISNLTEDGGVYDPQVYSWTTPGFHSMSMVDNSDNCRIRIRSTQGHQIIMDDTNERVYISTAGGKTWIEMDEAGNIDIYGERNISVHAEKDINFTAGETFRVKAKSIHMTSDDETRLHVINGSMHIKTGDTTEIHSIGDLSLSVSNFLLTAENNIDIKATGGVLSLESGADTNILSGANLNHQSSTVMNLNAGGDILQTGASIHLNGPGAGSAAPAFPTEPANTFESFWTNRIPEHEPWARQMTKLSADKDAGNSWDMEYSNYDDPKIGRTERGDDLGRNPKWHR